MTRIALILTLVLLNFASCFIEDIYLIARPPLRGQTAAITLRADRPFTLAETESEPAPGKPPRPNASGVHFRAGEVVVPFLKEIDEHDLRLVRALESQRSEALFRESPLVLFVNIWMVVFLGFFLFVLPRGGYRRSVSHPLLLVLLILHGLILKAILLFTALPVESLPLVLLPLLVVAMNQGRVTSVGTLLVGLVLATLFTGRSWDLLSSSLVVGLAAIMLAPQNLRLRSVILPCMLIGMVHAVFLILLRLDWSAIARLPHPADGWNMAALETLAAHPWATQSAWALWGGASSGALALLLLPLLKAGRTVGSTITLRRYADLDQFLLKRLFNEAPGTYQHSMNVAYLAQAAGDAIGANPLLLRIGAYFHDIGKLQQPEGYIENQLNGVNIHDTLDPYESIEIITGHVRHGLRIAQDARLPAEVIDLLQQHHGTQAIDYFFHKALKLKPKGTVNEGDFRYAGPKPQSIEAALLMIADAVEAASRSLKSPGRESFEKLVRFIVVKRIADSQFSECVLDTRDIDAIIRSLVDALEAAFHARVSYPWQQAFSSPTKEKKAAGAP
jgi:putative nucleotidyltransferase with HDIG domain